MKQLIRYGLTFLLVIAASPVLAQGSVDEPTGQKTLAATMNVYAFPSEGQAAAQQNRDEAECYSWAVNNTGNDPFDLSKRADQERQSAEQQKQQIAQSGQGAGAAGAVKGAAVGALVGEIASNDAGGGAAWGAAAGMIASRRRSRAGKQQATQQIDQQTARREEATAEELEGFKKAFSVCLESKKYLVKF